MLVILLPDCPYEKKKWPEFVQTHRFDEVPSDTCLSAISGVEMRLTLGNPIRNIMAKLWIFSHVLLKVPFMTVSHARSLNRLTSSHLKAAQWIRQAPNTDKDLLLTAKPLSSKEPCF